MKVMKSTVGIIVFTALFIFFLSNVPVVHAAGSPQTYLPISCDRAKGNYKPTTTLVLVPLNASLVVKAGATAEEIAKALFFEFAFVRGNNVSPINAIVHDGKISYIACNYPDYMTNIVSANDTGRFIVGISGAVPVKELQSLIDKLKISKLQQAELVSVTDEKNTTIALANEKNCTDLCMGLVANKEGISKREYKLSVEEPNYSKSIRQKELVSFSVKIKNESEFPLYAADAESLVLVSATKGISPMYHSSWLAPSLIARIPGQLLPGESTAISVTLGAPLLPGKYTESLLLKIGAAQIGKPLQLAFSVENDNYKLGRIVTKDGAPFANLRQTPSLKGVIINRLDIGTYVIIKDYQDAWVKIETKEGRVGWVYKPFLREL